MLTSDETVTAPPRRVTFGLHPAAPSFSERANFLFSSQSSSSSTSEDSSSSETDELEQSSTLLSKSPSLNGALLTQEQQLMQVPIASNAIDPVQREAAELTASPLKFRWAFNELVVSVVLGVLTGFSVAIFKLSIEAMRRGSYSLPFLANTPELMALIPAFGGVLVGIIAWLGAMPPGLRGQVAEIEDESAGPAIAVRERLTTQLNSWKKSAASVFTLGTGCSLGPEVCMNIPVQ